MGSTQLRLHLSITTMVAFHESHSHPRKPLPVSFPCVTATQWYAFNTLPPSHIQCTCRFGHGNKRNIAILTYSPQTVEDKTTAVCYQPLPRRVPNATVPSNIASRYQSITATSVWSVCVYRHVSYIYEVYVYPYIMCPMSDAAGSGADAAGF